MNSLTPAAAFRDDCIRWIPWPEFEDHAVAYQQLLNDLKGDSAALIECIITARRMKPGDNESWHREWQRTAESYRGIAEDAEANGALAIAATNWLRASNYFRASEIFLQADDLRRAPTVESMRSCSEKYVELLQPCGELVRISQIDGPDLEGYFLRAGSAAPKAPVAVCIGGWDNFKEGYLLALSRPANDCGISILLVEPQPQRSTSSRSHFGRFDVSISLSACIDYLLARSDVDPGKIAVYGLGAGAAFATELAVADSRINAAVCDGGALTTSRRAMVFRQMVDGQASPGNCGIEATVERLRSHAVRQGLLCPALVVSDSIDLADDITGAGSRCVFTVEGNEASAASVLDPSASQRYVLGWIAQTLNHAKFRSRKSQDGIKARRQAVSQLSRTFPAR